jgi:hypothetical protein
MHNICLPQNHIRVKACLINKKSKYAHLMSFLGILNHFAKSQEDFACGGQSLVIFNAQ